MFELLIHKHQFSPETASQLASIFDRLIIPEKSDPVLSFLKENGFSNSQLEIIVKCNPQLFSANIEKTIKTKLKIFQDFGFSESDIADIITINPNALKCSADNRIIPTLSVLRGYLGSSVQVSKVLKRSNMFFGLDPEKNMVPNIELLKSYGIPKADIIKHIMTPNFFLRKPEYIRYIRKSVDMANDMGFDTRKKTFLYTLILLGTMSDKTVKLKLKAFQDMGFSENDTLKLFKISPTLLCSCEKRIKKVKELLLENGMYDVLSIMKNSSSLTYSIENRYIPRVQVLRILEKKNLIQKWPGLSELATSTDAMFFEKFVAPYLSEVSDMFVLKNACSNKRNLKIAQTYALVSI